MASRRFFFGLLVALVLVLASGETNAASSRISVLRVKGTINPILAGYITRGINLAEERGDIALVIQLDTPGGLDTSMRDIIQRILGARIPVIVYVSPAGSRAASAGTFITMAGHVAAMAPNTSIGAAHPVSGPGLEIGGTVAEKVTNDAVAYIKSIANLRQRNAQWAEAAVRESASITEQEALQLRVIDVVSTDLPSLIAQLDRREVTLMSGSRVLSTRAVEIAYIDMGWVENFLFVISDPNIAYILLSLAMTALFLELSNPGAILPGIVGGISLLLALFSLGMLPVNYAGLLLIVLAFILFLAEVWVTSHGMLTVGGVTSLTLGSLILINSSAPYLMISRWVIGAVVISITSFFVFVVGAVVRAHRQQATTGREGLVGRVAVARSELNPSGTVFLQGERWNAICDNGRVEPGEEVKVVKVEGLRLRVMKTK